MGFTPRASRDKSRWDHEVTRVVSSPLPVELGFITEKGIPPSSQRPSLQGVVHGHFLQGLALQDRQEKPPRAPSSSFLLFLFLSKHRGAQSAAQANSSDWSALRFAALSHMPILSSLHQPYGELTVAACVSGLSSSYSTLGRVQITSFNLIAL